MRCARMTRNTLAAVIGMAGLGFGIVRALPARAAPVKASIAPRYVVLSCSRKLEVKPRDFTTACADNGFGMTNMRWTSWTSHLASGYGTVYENDNYPNHAEGRIYQVSALVVLWGSAPVQGHPAERDLHAHDGHLSARSPCDLRQEGQREIRRDLPRDPELPRLRKR